jgi:hypothetical protein
MIPQRNVVDLIAIDNRRTPVLTILVALLFAASAATRAEDSVSKQPVYDTIIKWEPALWDGTTPRQDISCYLDGKFVGSGDEGFKAALEKISRLPSGTSVVWGPNGEKLVSGPKDPVTPENLFPSLWKQFQQTAKARGLVLSSFAYTFYVEDDADAVEPLIASYIEPGAAKEKDDVIVTWMYEKRKAESEFDQPGVIEGPVYYLDGRRLGSGADGVRAALEALRNYPDGSRLRVVWSNSQWSSSYNASEPPGVGTFRAEFRELLASKRFRSVIECNKKQWPKYANCPKRCRLEWRQIHSDELTPEGVVYLIDGKAAGTGNAGFDAVLEHLRQLPPGAYLVYPQYHLNGRTSGPKEIREIESKDPVPFRDRRKELSDLVKQNRLVVDRGWTDCLGWSEYGGRVREDVETNWYLASLLQFAAIVRDGAKPAKADAIISWKRKLDQSGQPASEATYSYDGQETGVGTTGFLAILKRLESLPDGAAVRIDPVCIRTHAPFTDPVVMKGQRHFEITGEEPFRGMVDLLAEFAKRKRLHVEVIPDEGGPHHDPGM